MLEMLSGYHVFPGSSWNLMQIVFCNLFDMPQCQTGTLFGLLSSFSSLVSIAFFYWQKRRRPTTGGQLDDKRREMLKRHPLSLCLDLKCKGNSVYILDNFKCMCLHQIGLHLQVICNVSIAILCIVVTQYLPDSKWKKVSVTQSAMMSWHHLTLVFPLLAIKGIVTDYREICIAGVTLPKGGRRGGERDACSIVGLQHLQHAVSIFSHHQSFFFNLCLCF